MSQNIVKLCFGIVSITATVAFATVVLTELKRYIKLNKIEDNKHDKK